MKTITNSQEETEIMGQKLARKLKKGDVVALFGTLGAGKTAFTRGVARGLGYNDRVTSPTYTIVNEYQGDIKIFHFDMYRLMSADELYDIGWDDYLKAGGIVITEWSENIEPELPNGYISVKIKKMDENRREIDIRGV